MPDERRELPIAIRFLQLLSMMSEDPEVWLGDFARACDEATATDGVCRLEKVVELLEVQSTFERVIKLTKMQTLRTYPGVIVVSLGVIKSGLTRSRSTFSSPLLRLLSCSHHGFGASTTVLVGLNFSIS